MLFDLPEEDIRWIRDTLIHVASNAPLAPPKKDGVLDRLNQAIVRSVTKELEKRVQEDFDKVALRVVLLGVGVTGCGYPRNANDAAGFVLDTPALVLIDKSRDPHEHLMNWQNDFIDPIWDIQLLDAHPQLDKLHGCWVDARSYCADPDGEHGKPIPYELISDILAARDE